VPRHAQLREHLGQCRADANAPAEVQELELHVLVLHDDPEDDVAGQSWRYVLPLGDDIVSGLVSCLVDGEHGDCRGHAHEPELPGHHNAEAPALAVSDGQEVVLRSSPIGALSRSLPVASTVTAPAT
jgi:hypothetical protein